MFYVKLRISLQEVNCYHPLMYTAGNQFRPGLLGSERIILIV
jgi:hypothetical protein